MITIHEANVGDAEGILDVHNQSWISTYPVFDGEPTKEDIEEYVKSHSLIIWRDRLNEITQGKLNVWVAKDGDKVVGFCKAGKGDELNHLDAIYILKEYQTQGVGKRLIEKALHWLGDQIDVEVHVVRYNKQAIKFYESQGFTLKGEDQEKDWLKLPSGFLLKGFVMLKKYS